MSTIPMIRAHCNACSRETKHDVIAEKGRHDSAVDPEGYEIEWTVTHRMIECRGCESISMHISWWHSEFDVSDDVTLYPPRTSRVRPKWSNELPAELSGLLTETYSALQAGTLRLALMGARSCVDVYMNLTIGDIGGFADKLRGLVDAGHLSTIDKGILNAALDAGHAVSHRGHIPSSDEANQVMDIVENLLQKLALSKSAEKLSKTTPARVRGSRGSKTTP